MVGLGLCVIGAALLVMGSMLNTGVPTPGEGVSSVRLLVAGSVILLTGLGLAAIDVISVARSAYVSYVP